MTAVEKLHVQIGQVKIGVAGQSLEAILGSCIGLGFLHASQQIYGLAHCLLPKSDGTVTKGDGRYVDQAIESLLRMMNIDDKERRKVQVCLAGGANMTKPSGTDPKHLVGSANADAARQVLKAAKMRTTTEDLGGELGRRVIIDCTTGELTINTIPRLGSI